LKDTNTAPENYSTQYDTGLKNSDAGSQRQSYDDQRSPGYDAQMSEMAIYADRERSDGPTQREFAYVTIENSRNHMVTLYDGTSVCNECASNNGLPLRAAVKNGHAECVQQQLSQTKVDVNLRDDEGFTLFTLALLHFDVCDKKDRGDICLLFTENGANVNEGLGDGTTPLHIACAKGRDDIA